MTPGPRGAHCHHRARRPRTAPALASWRKSQAAQDTLRAGSLSIQAVGCIPAGAKHRLSCRGGSDVLEL